MEKDNDIEKLEREHARQTTKAFSLAIEIIFIFGVPALLGVYIGGEINETSNTPTYIALAVAFVLSWCILLYRIRGISRTLKEHRTKIEQEKAQQEVN